VKLVLVVVTLVHYPAEHKWQIVKCDHQLYPADMVGIGLKLCAEIVWKRSVGHQIWFFKLDFFFFYQNIISVNIISNRIIF
jgi:hypothetical protein